VILLFWLLGLLFIGLAIPLLRRRVRPNALYGLRVQETLENEEVWYEANARSARDLLWIGVATIVVPTLLMGTPWFGSDSFFLVFCICLVAVVLWYAARGFRIAREVKRDLNLRKKPESTGQSSEIPPDLNSQ